MKLIIDIDEEMFEAIKFKKEHKKLNPSEIAILNGTPLPDEPSPQNLEMWKKIFEEERRRANEADN